MIRAMALLLPFHQPFMAHDDLEMLARRLVDTPVFVEHRWNDQPIGRVAFVEMAQEGLMVELSLDRRLPDGMRALAIAQVPADGLAAGQHPARGRLEVSICQASLHGGRLVALTDVTRH